MPSTCKKRSSSSVWIPPPALTSRSRPSTTKNDKSLTSPKDANMKVKLDSQLEAVLKDIEKFKEEVLNNLSEDQKKLSMMENNLHKPEKAVLVLQHIEKEKSKIEQTLDSIKRELLLKAEENVRLNKQQDALSDRLKLIEESASQAIKSIIPVSQFVRNLKTAKEERNELSEKYLQDIISKLLNLVNMNQLVLNSVTVKDEELSESSESPYKSKDLQVSQLKEEIDRLQLQLNEDRKKIISLQKVAQDRSIHEKETQRFAIIQKERANKYLIVIEHLKSQIYQKNTEMDQLTSEINSLKLQNSQFKGEKDRLEIEKNTLQCTMVKIQEEKDGKKMKDDRVDELSFKLSQAMINIERLEAEKIKLQANLTESDAEIQQLKLETEQLNSRMREMVNKITQTSLVEVKDEVKEVDDRANSRLGLDLWQELQKDKGAIIQSLKDLEKKLEVSQQTNLEFRNEISSKEEGLQQINMKLQEKIEENHCLRRLLESELTEVKKYTYDVTQKPSFNIGQLEVLLSERKHENEQLKRDMSEMENKYKVHIDEINERLELAEKAKNTMHDYVKFLKTSYASVFGDL
ncbi:hypothetical protein CHUAL_007272 [Chamberlinius hualienensis]